MFLNLSPGIHPGVEVEFALSRGGRVLLADEMGLGKTAQATINLSRWSI